MKFKFFWSLNNLFAAFKLKIISSIVMYLLNMLEYLWVYKLTVMVEA